MVKTEAEDLINQLNVKPDFLSKQLMLETMRPFQAFLPSQQPVFIFILN